ncbi:MAG: hypothetical protein IPG04_12820 [Polyangiaceae bacterium]|nr:hypothetical protein [Polyangiaceae bacterium]
MHSITDATDSVDVQASSMASGSEDAPIGTERQAREQLRVTRLQGWDLEGGGAAIRDVGGELGVGPIWTSTIESGGEAHEEASIGEREGVPQVVVETLDVERLQGARHRVAAPA